MFFSKKILSSIVLSTALIFSASANATEKSKEVDCRSYQELDEYYNCFTEQQEKYKKQLDAKVKKEIERLNKNGAKFAADALPKYIEAWNAYVQVVCSIYSSDYGQMSHLLETECLTDETKAEIKHLDKILQRLLRQKNF